eukprot:2957228-Amphidinium_carterae.1
MVTSLAYPKAFNASKCPSSDPPEEPLNKAGGTTFWLLRDVAMVASAKAATQSARSRQGQSAPTAEQKCFCRRDVSPHLWPNLMHLPSEPPYLQFKFKNIIN